MKKIILSLSLIFSFSVKSQIKALTEDGKEVILFDNKTWKFVNDSDEKTLETISTNDQPFERSKDASFLIKSRKLDAGLYFNPKIWKITKSPFNSPSIEYVFTNNASPTVFGVFTTENAPIQTLKNLKEIIISGIQKNADYFRLKESEYRTVNNIKVLYLAYSANAKGIDFEYISNLYLTPEGYCSISSYTYGNKYEENKKVMADFINGLVPSEKGKEVVETAPPPPMSTKK
ncbi:hypothetical protein CEY12_18660 [Chryseobacterium sp. T16E-39]|uniref:hypothetical protein n=1 Tax=Chryseobacterium sp. T16E-39 TaxID=2015076 RepID=UPI000B5B2B9F|nr:hypothetical protein [Chryseobacterium sp. T16E-39]ASK31999.1 hypothetical protein CEY12_18660 [Chryseobacterium sp. T16E-39]